MPYKIKYQMYFKQTNLCTEKKYYSYNGNENFTLESIKTTIENWSYDAKEIKNSLIKHRNGDETWFMIEYNGKWCKKYRNGIKD